MSAVVLGDHLLNIHRRMTLITFQDGKVVLRENKVATGQECCCCDPCLVRLCTGYAVCIIDPNDTSAEQWTCDVFANAFLWLKDALESVGWTVTISEWPLQEVIDASGGGEICDLQCRQKFVAECRLCDLNSPEDGEWLSLEEYVVDHPLPAVPPLNGVPQSNPVEVGFSPINLHGSFPCDGNRGSGFTTTQGACGNKPYFSYFIPVCNPLP